MKYLTIETKVSEALASVLNHLYGVTGVDLSVTTTKKEFVGDYTFVVFPFLKQSRKSPEATAAEMGEALVRDYPTLVKGFNVVKGFLNIELQGTFFVDQLWEMKETEGYGIETPASDAPLYMVEYSSPNTNKPLHLGHIRNNLLGYSISKILEANGKRVVKTNIVNDRGIHICKSMLAWKKWGEGATPESTGLKGDHLIGDFYVLFDKHYKAELKELEAKGLSTEEAEKQSTLMQEARAMLKKWEQGDEEIRSMWKMMNSWVYAGFDETYKRLGVDFDKIYYESDTYLVGRDEVLRGLQEGIFVKDEDGSVWADLTSEGYDRKILLRADGTSVYITQDIGTAKLRFQDYPIDQMIYVVGNEQDYHFQVLSIILDKLGYSFGKDLKHFSYGMVELPEGKMKSREGTVVDADDLMDKMVETALEASEGQGRAVEMSEEERREMARRVGLGALKYFLLKVEPRKNMLFDPKESIDFNGNTGPFIQYTYARIQSILRKAEGIDFLSAKGNIVMEGKEIALVKRLNEFGSIVNQAGNDLNPGALANYAYDLGKEFNQFYHDHSILNEADEAVKRHRLLLAYLTSEVLRKAVGLLGIEMPERM
ncbi:arginine--tRNA ligase [Porphyromonas levii]|uniref:arginine--tRNA ligase n=1 Tax=Porphyromonas levii TaxID=28114 RepID=UPI001DC70AE1|nr:arginine--tRNA ligase [Porphyromonas levii]MBR8713292.1 Arginine--tRNA ligase [Porphyromonas levii]MBR8715298.1 Arginine--tRNA ligase [Porphyromonas levii]MBR8727824.1 Arginine--tRNA ligase [Porphyromonas levii]MBR8736168.1 Arginine--tRNA ligase [Porphyromonas levii]MBR8764217.1 Arginine--tRNA ligase [Porphyromonas levii]